MSHSLSVEHWRVTGAIAAILVIGLLTQYWILAVILPSAAYVGWNLYQFRRLERWLIGGVKTSESPDGGGIWALVVRYLFRREHTEKKRKKHYKDVLQRLSSVISVLPDAA